MRQKIIAIVIVSLFVLSILPISIVEAQTLKPQKVTQEIAPQTTLTSDFADTAKIKLDTSSNDNIKAARVKPAPTPKSYALTIEIDYIEGHEPTQAVLDYMTSYYQARNIKLTININEKISDPTGSYANGVSDAEFWTIEKTYNQGADALNSGDGKYTLPEKWVLYGTTVEGSETTVGYTYITGNFRDIKAGNYIYIADQSADDWASGLSVSLEGAEAVVLMHEFGHSIGIAIVRLGAEIYCSDYYCVMSYLRTQNAEKIYNWYYCTSHWNTKNIDYYAV